MTQQAKKKKKNGAVGRKMIRTIWVIFRNLLIPILIVLAVMIGLIIGYAVMGKKTVPTVALSDVFEWQTWKHVYDLVFSNNG